MASVGHIAVGMAAARLSDPSRVPTWSSMILWSGLSLLPDADVIGFAFGVQYGDRWGHRGATHSLAAAIAVGALMGLGARWLKRRALRTALVATAVLASHSILDSMTDGGLGCAFLWPFDLTRYFAPWRPIPVAPIGLPFFSLTGATIALIELVLFAPLLVFALPLRGITRSRAAAALSLASWLASVWLISSADPVRDAIVGLAVREDTAYAAGFSESAFRTVSPGQSEHAVRQLLGAPVRESWFYAPTDQPFESAETRSAAALPHDCSAVFFERGAVARAFDRAACSKRGIEIGMSPHVVEPLLGDPSEICWQYTWSPGNRSHRMRIICFARGNVHTVFRRWHLSAD